MASAEDYLQAVSAHLTLMRAFGERLQKLRNEARLSEDQLAERSRLNPSIIAKAEAGDTDPRFLQIESFARGLGVLTSALIEGLAPAARCAITRDAATAECA